jgi:hypothetical protein
MTINRYRFLIILCMNFAIIFMFIPRSHSFELSGNVRAEGRFFFNKPLFADQERHDIALAIEPEFYHETETGSSFTFTPFIRADSADSERSHFDIRELNYLWVTDSWELRAGVSKVFWGVTEFLHLVDIINQTDLVEYIDGEDKLGQPMVHVSIPRDWGVMDFFILPYFRERTFPGEKGRFRSQIVVDTESVMYESSDKENHIDFALRYSHTIGNWDVGMYHFNGTGREPTFVTGLDSDGRPFLRPFYELIDQTGLDLQVVQGNWLLKLEAIYRSGQGESFYAAVGGFEYSSVNVASSGTDMGLIGEWAYDDRGKDATSGFDNDIMAGLRIALNDAFSTELLAGLITGLDNNDMSISLESSRRLSDNLKIEVDAFIVIDSSEDSIIHSFRDDDNIQVELSLFF